MYYNLFHKCEARLYAGYIIYLNEVNVKHIEPRKSSMKKTIALFPLPYREKNST